MMPHNVHRQILLPQQMAGGSYCFPEQRLWVCTSGGLKLDLNPCSMVLYVRSYSFLTYKTILKSWKECGKDWYYAKDVLCQRGLPEILESGAHCFETISSILRLKFRCHHHCQVHCGTSLPWHKIAFYKKARKRCDTLPTAVKLNLFSFASSIDYGINYAAFST